MFAGRRLFVRIFAWFWLTVIATGVSLILTFVLQQKGVPRTWANLLGNTAHYHGSIAISELDQAGARGAANVLQGFEREAHLRACLFDSNGAVIAGENCSYFADVERQLETRSGPVLSMKFGIARTAVWETGAGKRRYIYTTELPFGPQAAFRGHRLSFVLEWCVGLFVSGAVCYLLARHIAMPILHLRSASQKLAAGELTARAPASMERRSDELGELVNDFNIMADRLEQLVVGQRQLICDISHELRSPLSRLNVALDLAREGKCGGLPYEHMEQDLAALDEMIGRLLTIARLDAAPQTIAMEEVNLTELIAAVARDAGFESQQRNVQIAVKCSGEFSVSGNCELLHSAVENIVRNAIHYTEPGTPVEIELRAESAEAAKRVRLAIRDHGPGLPEKELSKIFTPFYRVAESRDRASGGVGLGLAIAERVVRLHQGVIRAENAEPRGLRVEIELPMAR